MTTEEKDARASLKARRRDRDTCRIAMPGCTGRAGGVHHIFPRAIESVRWYLPNLLSVCGGCHAWAHDNPEEMQELCRTALMPAGEWEELVRRKDADW